MVGDGHAMGVAAQILEHKLWATEGWFQIDDPVCSVQGSEPGGKDVWLSEEDEVSVKTELAITEGLLESGDKLSAKEVARDPKHLGLPVSVSPARLSGVRIGPSPHRARPAKNTSDRAPNAVRAP